MEAGHLEDEADDAACSIAEAIEGLLAAAPRCAAPRQGPAPVAFLHQDPQRPVAFGGWFGRVRAPVAFLEAPSRELMAYLAGDPSGPFRRPGDLGRESERGRWGFRVDGLEGLLKADWHTLPHLGPEAEVFLPRLGRCGLLPRAPPRILAFVVALRAVNRAAWSAMAEALRGLGRRGGSGERAEFRGRVLRSLAECFANRRHFGAVEAQVWWGGPGAKRLPSHKDGAPSLLHLGVTLGGRRTLRAGVFRAASARGNLAPGARSAAAAAGLPPGTLPLAPTAAAAGLPPGVLPLMGMGLGGPQLCDPVGPGEKNVWDEDLWHKEHLREMPMTPGSVYLSSPYCFEHAVCYEACSERDPVVALQCRFGFPEDLGARLNDLRDGAMLEAATVVSQALRAASASGRLRLPSLHEVVRAEAELRLAAA